VLCSDERRCDAAIVRTHGVRSVTKGVVIGGLGPARRAVERLLPDITVHLGVWMPSAGFVLPDDMQARIGEKVVGIGLLELNAGSMGFDLWCPDGMNRHDLGAMPVFRS
jgi:hypothetical protein